MHMYASLHISPVYIFSRASGVGSPTNHPGSGQRQDTGPGILWSVHRWTKPNTYGGASILPRNLKRKSGPYIGPVLLRQGEPGTSQYCRDPPLSCVFLKRGPILCNPIGWRLQPTLHLCPHATVTWGPLGRWHATI